MLGEYLDKFVMVYLDNVIIYFNSKEEHKKYIKQVLSRLYKENILIAVKKYKFILKRLIL